MLSVVLLSLLTAYIPTTHMSHFVGKYFAYHSIRWKDDAVTRDAVAFLAELLTPPVSSAFYVCLQAGEGIVCNNVLHNRAAFHDAADAEQHRLLWRARYHDRIAVSSSPDVTA